MGSGGGGGGRRGRPRRDELSGLLGPEATTVALGLASALAWGAADFGGGLASRRAALFGVVLLTFGVGAVLSFGLYLVSGEPMPTATDLGWALAAGVTGGVGITALYGGLAAGRMGVVAPVTGVVAAAIPVLVGTVVEGLPRPLVAVGIGLALVAVVLVGRTHDPEDGPSGLPYGLLAGTAIGAFNVCVAQFGAGRIFGPFTVVRLVEIVLVGAVVLLGRRPWRLARPLLAPVALVGILDMAGNGFFIAAAQVGRLDVAAVLSSLYPVTTVVLAIGLLRERVTPSHAVGIALAGVAVALIAGG